ncbi:hypothetical protein [Sphingobacterium hotanense]|uniref:hypothetical protein n=1 Tax=Sphingobacterium hotanense TaxID=649196 RepID=UPI0021A57005|nr:hypothetical protein [Sphingobacterium hotanense]MCT1525444.1 hypothetical protein [Sphingobacterium hotanense]
MLFNKTVLRFGAFILLLFFTACARGEMELFPEEIPEKGGRKDFSIDLQVNIFPQQVNIDMHANGNYPKYVKPEFIKNIGYNNSSYCHPDVQYFPDGFQGYKYWMVFTPYFGSIGGDQLAKRYENPTVVVSNDGLNWAEPAGIVNPIQACPGYKESFREIQGEQIQGFSSDVDWLFEGGEFQLYYRGSFLSAKALSARGAKSLNNRVKLIKNARRTIVRQTSKDGVHWDPLEAVMYSDVPYSPKNSHMLSPSFLKVGEGYVSYEVELNSGKKHFKQDKPSFVIQRSSTNGLDFSRFSNSKIVNFINEPWIRQNRDNGPWHLQASYVDGFYFLCIAVGDVKKYTADQLYLAFSNDGLNFYVCPKPIITEDAYRSAIFPKTVDDKSVQFGAMLGYKTGVFKYAEMSLQWSQMQELIDNKMNR